MSCSLDAPGRRYCLCEFPMPSDLVMGHRRLIELLIHDDLPNKMSSVVLDFQPQRNICEYLQILLAYLNLPYHVIYTCICYSQLWEPGITGNA